MAQQEPQFTVEMLPEIDVRTFVPKGNRLLVKPYTLTSDKIGSVIAADDTKLKMQKMLINKGVIVSIGPNVEDKLLQPGIEVFFFRGNSAGGLREGNQELLLFQEFAIEGQIDEDAARLVEHQKVAAVC